MDDFERDYLERALLASGGNVSAAARHGGVSRQQLQRLMRKHDVDSAQFRADDAGVDAVRVLRRAAGAGAHALDVCDEETVEVASRR